MIRKPKLLTRNELSFSILLINIILYRLENNFVESHGRLMEPPARNSMWRLGYPNPVDYNDNELYCGGYSVQWLQNGGKCGICGDPWHLKPPRPHESGGKFGRRIISRNYLTGQVIDIVIELTTNHRGRFELNLCPNNNPKEEANQSCFDSYPLLVEDTRDVRYFIPKNSSKHDKFRYRARLPASITCSQCVLQWTYYTANTWGICDNGTQRLGCGHPETFRNCADIKIVSNFSDLSSQSDNSVDFLEAYDKFNLNANMIHLYANAVKQEKVNKKKKKKIIKDKENETMVDGKQFQKKKKKKKVLRKKRLLHPRRKQRTRLQAEFSTSTQTYSKSSRSKTRRFENRGRNVRTTNTSQDFGIRLN